MSNSLQTQPDIPLGIPNPSLAHGQSGFSQFIMSSYELSNKTIILEPIKYKSYYEMRYIFFLKVNQQYIKEKPKPGSPSI